MPEPAEKPSLHSYLRERYGSSTQKLVREHERSLHSHDKVMTLGLTNRVIEYASSVHLGGGSREDSTL